MMRKWCYLPREANVLRLIFKFIEKALPGPMVVRLEGVADVTDLDSGEWDQCSETDGWITLKH